MARKTKTPAPAPAQDEAPASTPANDLDMGLPNDPADAEAEAQFAEFIGEPADPAEDVNAEQDRQQAEEAAAIAEIEAQIALPKSVVGRSYKLRYKERAMEAGLRGKAAKRSCNDWLAQELNGHCLDEKEKLIVDTFEAILTANGVKHEHWNRVTNGWQGRLRMTGRLALQRIVAETGVLVLPEGETLEAPADWVAKHTH